MAHGRGHAQIMRQRDSRACVVQIDLQRVVTGWQCGLNPDGPMAAKGLHDIGARRMRDAPDLRRAQTDHDPLGQCPACQMHAPALQADLVQIA